MAMSYEHAPFGRFEVRAMQDCRCENRHPERRNREGSRHNVLVSVLVIVFFAVAAFAAPKSASAYYSDAAFQYIENRLPSAEITCNEGLQYYPNDQKLQMLLDRIKEAKDEQKNENKKNDKNQDNNQDQNKDDGQSSSSGENQNQDQQNGQDGQSSSSQGESSDSNSSGSDGGAQPEQQPEQPEENSSDSEGDSSNDGGQEPEEQPVPMGEMSPEEAAQLLKDFDEQNGERKPWKPIRGQARPAKDW